MRTFAVAGLSAFLLLFLAGCSNGGDGGTTDVPTTSWRLDSAATLEHVEAESKSWTEKQLQGLSVALELKRGGEFELKIAGGEHAGDTTGRWRPDNDGYTLVSTAAGGASKEDHVKQKDRNHLQIMVGGLRATLTRQ
jgi:hypothetical protein